MTYETLLINDSGAVEIADTHFNQKYNYRTFLEELKQEKQFSGKDFTVELEMYNDKEFNALNDILHSPIDYIVNNKVAGILEKHHLPPHTFIPANVIRKENFLFLKKSKTFAYKWFCFDCEHIENYYNYIDFEKSDISFFRGKDAIHKEIKGITDIYDIIRENGRLSDKINEIYKDKSLTNKEKENRSAEFQTTKWVANTIVLNKNFDSSIDIFRLPLFSWMTFVSEKLRNAFLEENISGIHFSQTGIKSKLPGVANPKIILV